MLGLGAATRIVVATGKTDMRPGFNRLYALVTAKLQQHPQSGHLFLLSPLNGAQGGMVMPDSGPRL